MASAVNVIWFSTIEAEILSPPVILNDRSSPSISLADKIKILESSSSKTTFDKVASTGASFTAVTLRLTLAVDKSIPSLTLNTKISFPLKLALGV